MVEKLLHWAREVSEYRLLLHQKTAATGLSGLLEPTPMQPISLPDVGTVLVKREDLRHPVISGNKWHKLKFSLALSLLQGHRPLLSCGGSFSNHIHALAAAGCYFSLPTAAIIRDTSPVDTPTLRDARRWGMSMKKVNRTFYRQRSDFGHSLDWKRYFPHYSRKPIWIPEGGSSRLGILGVAELAIEMIQQQDLQVNEQLMIRPEGQAYWFLPCATGATLAGLVAGIHWLGLTDRIKVIGIAVLKARSFMPKMVSSYLAAFGVPDVGYEIFYDEHHGGYAKSSDQLAAYQRRLAGAPLAVDLDKIYTEKLFYAVEKLIKEEVFSTKDRLVLIHTGGLQGNR